MPIPKEMHQAIVDEMAQKTACPTFVGDRLEAFARGRAAALQYLAPHVSVDVKEEEPDGATCTTPADEPGDDPSAAG